MIENKKVFNLGIISFRYTKHFSRYNKNVNMDMYQINTDVWSTTTMEPTTDSDTVEHNIKNQQHSKKLKIEIFKNYIQKVLKRGIIVNAIPQYSNACVVNKDSNRIFRWDEIDKIEMPPRISYSIDDFTSVFMHPHGKTVLFISTQFDETKPKIKYSKYSIRDQNGVNIIHTIYVFGSNMSIDDILYLNYLFSTKQIEKIKTYNTFIETYGHNENLILSLKGRNITIYKATIIFQLIEQTIHFWKLYTKKPLKIEIEGDIGWVRHKQQITQILDIKS